MILRILAHGRDVEEAEAELRVRLLLIQGQIAEEGRVSYVGGLGVDSALPASAPSSTTARPTATGRVGTVLRSGV